MKLKIQVPLTKDSNVIYYLNGVGSISTYEFSSKLYIDLANTIENRQTLLDLHKLVLNSYHKNNHTQAIYRGTLRIGEEIFGGVFLVSEESYTHGIQVSFSYDCVEDVAKDTTQ